LHCNQHLTPPYLKGDILRLDFDNKVLSVLQRRPSFSLAAWNTGAALGNLRRRAGAKSDSAILDSWFFTALPAVDCSGLPQSFIPTCRQGPNLAVIDLQGSLRSYLTAIVGTRHGPLPQSLHPHPHAELSWNLKVSNST
jgi:hypothetical protein